MPALALSTVNPMSATNPPSTAATMLEPSSAERADLAAGGAGLFSELEAIELAWIDKAGGKKLFCRLPSPLKSTLRAHLDLRP
jgi:hypothetical protein